MKNVFSLKGNIWEANSVRRCHAYPSPYAKKLAVKIQLIGLDITPITLSRIEQNKRHVCDAELKAIALALNVSVDWLICGTEVYI